MNNKVFVIGAALLAVVAFIIFKLMPQAPAPVAQAPINLVPAYTAENFIREHSPVLGKKDAKVVVTEWFDPQCESCREMHPIVSAMITQYRNRVKFVFRYMPYHPGSMYASSALAEAHELGKFEQALDTIFEHQPEWGDHHSAKPELIPGYLLKIGIPKAKLDQDLIAKHGAKVRQDEADGNAVGVTGTPTFFINGKMLRELGEEPLRSAIEAELSANPE